MNRKQWLALGAWAHGPDSPERSLDPSPVNREWNTARVSTACWSFDLAKGHHHIAVGNVIKTAGNAKVQTPGRTATGFLRSVYTHEVCHGLYTERDQNKLKADIIKHGATPSVWNICEDIAIEARYRRENKGFRFGWQRYQDIVKETSNPWEWLIAAKSLEMRPRTAAKRVKWTGPAETRLGRPAERVLVAALNQCSYAPDSGRTAHIAGLLIKHFGTGHTMPASVGGSAAHGLDDSSVPSPASGPAPAPVPSTPPSVKAPPVPPHAPATWQKALPSGQVSKVTSKGLDYYCHDDLPPTRVRQALDWQAINRVFERLEGLCIRAGWQPDQLANSGSRLHMPSVSVGRPDAFRRKTPAKGRPKVAVIVDMSGSMAHSWVRGGRDFIVALCMMHRRGLIDGRFWLTGARGCAKLCPMDVDILTLSLLFPWKDNESFKATLEKAKPDLQWADTVLCYTDGCLTDGSVEAGDYRKMGIDLIGTAIESSGELDADEIRRMLVHHFGRAITAPTAEQLGSRIVSYILARKQD